MWDKVLRPVSQQAAFDASMGLRGWAATAVFFAHFHDQAEKYIDPSLVSAKFATYFEPLAHVAVNLFFIVSAFLLYGALMRGRQKVLPFIFRRAKRIYPAFLVIFMVYVALSYALPQHSKLPVGFADQLAYLAACLALLPGIFPIEPLMAVAWTLSYEMAFYIFLPFFFTAFSLWERSLRARLIILFASFVFIHIAIPSHHIAAMFVVGMAIWEVWNFHKDRPLPIGTGSAALLLWFCFIWLYLFSVTDRLVVDLPAVGNQTILIIAFAPIIFCTMMPRNSATRVFAWRPISYLGNLSYSFYLIHGLCIHGFFMIFTRIFGTASWTSDLFYWVLMLAALIVSYAASAVLYLCVERPFSIDGVGVRHLFIEPERHRKTLKTAEKPV